MILVSCKQPKNFLYCYVVLLENTILKGANLKFCKNVTADVLSVP